MKKYKHYPLTEEQVKACLAIINRRSWMTPKRPTFAHTLFVASASREDHSIESAIRRVCLHMSLRNKKDWATNIKTEITRMGTAEKEIIMLRVKIYFNSHKRTK